MSVYVSSSEFVHFIFIWFPSFLNFIVPLSILFIRFSLSVQLLSSPSFTISPSMLVFSHFFLIHSFRLSFFLCPSFMLMGIAVVPLLHFPYISFLSPLLCFYLSLYCSRSMTIPSWVSGINPYRPLYVALPLLYGFQLCVAVFVCRVICSFVIL